MRSARLRVTGVRPTAQRRKGWRPLGERQRIALAATLLLRRPIVLIDEPTNSLDSENRALIIDQLKNAGHENTIIIMATHDAQVEGRDRRGIGVHHVQSCTAGPAMCV